MLCFLSYCTKGLASALRLISTPKLYLHIIWGSTDNSINILPLVHYNRYSNNGLRSVLR